MDKYDKLFYLRKDRQNRLIPMVSAVDDDGKFHAWLVKGNDIIDWPVIDLREGEYFAKVAASDKDIYFDFLNFLYQRNTCSAVFPMVGYITNDMRNLAASLRKIELFYEISHKENVTRLIVSELEYILTVCRSLYDHFQFIVKHIWAGVKLMDSSIKRNSLSDSFSAMVLKGNQIRTVEEIAKTYGLTASLAKFYSDETAFFERLRSFRDDIVHRGLTPGYIYVTERGFSVEKEDKFFSSFNVWTPKCFYKNDRLASLKPVIAHIIQETLSTMGRFALTLQQQIKYPEDIAPGYHIFMRGEYLHKLAELDSYIKDDVWYSDSVEGAVVQEKTLIRSADCGFRE